MNFSTDSTNKCRDKAESRAESKIEKSSNDFISIFKRGFPLCILSTALGLTACQKGKPPELVTSGPSQITAKKVKAGQENQIAADQKQSLVIEKHPTKKLLRLAKGALGKEFIFTNSILSNGATPNWMSTTPNFVYFQKQGEQVLLFAKSAYAIYDSVDSSHLLQQFRIFREDNQALVFDLGSGFDSMIIQSPVPVKINDVDLGRELGADGVAVLLNPAISQLSQADEIISIDQIGKLKLNKKTERVAISDDFEIGTKARFELQPYRTSESFQKIETDSETNFAYLQQMTTVPAYKTKIKPVIEHWDFSESRKPIQILITSNTPKIYLNSILEAISYWTKAIGAEKFEIKKEVDPGAVPPLRSILFRWVEFEDSSFAWASNQADPRTGEILRAQVALTSSWVRILGSVMASESDPLAAQSRLNPLGFSKICELTLNNARGVSLLSNERTAEMFQHRFRSTVAHEMGHALGLGHNFAASFNIDLRPGEMQKLRESFLSDPQVKPTRTAISVMDYFTMEDDFLAGALVKENILPYDSAAIRYSMTADRSLLSVDPRWKACTNEDIVKATQKGFKLYGCETFDSGANPFASANFETQKNVSGLYAKMFELILLQMNPGPSDQRVPLPVVLNKWTPDIFHKFLDVGILGGLEKIRPYLLVDRKNKEAMALGSSTILYSVFEKNIWNQKDYVKTATSARFGADFVEAGGLAQVFASFLPLNPAGHLDFAAFDKQIESLVSSERFKSGKTAEGRSYVLTKEEQAILKQFFQIKKTEISEKLTAYISMWIPNDENAFNKLLQSSAWYPNMIKMATRLFLASSGVQNFAIGNKVIALPNYDLDDSVRVKMAKLFESNAFGFDSKFEESEILISTARSNLQKVFAAAYEYEALKNGELVGKKTMPSGAKELEEEIKRLVKQDLISQEVADSVEPDLTIFYYLD